MIQPQFIKDTTDTNKHSISISPNTYVFTAIPNMYTVNSSNCLIPAITTTIAGNYYPKM